MTTSTSPSSTHPPVLTRRERVMAALKGGPTDRVPISLWRHFPGEDRTPEGLAQATAEFQARYDVDLVKLMPTGMYSVIDYGVAVRDAGDTSGTTRFVSGPIAEPADWARLPTASPRRGTLKDQVEVVRLVRQALDPETPVLQTVFSPLTMAAKMIGGDLTPALADDNALRPGLARMTRDVVEFGQACLEAGGDGFFFATQLASRTALANGMYERLGVPYDLEILEALRGRAKVVVLHLHGSDPLFELADRYPIDAVNWHDRETYPSLVQALDLTRRALVAGLARSGAVVSGSSEEAAAEVRDAIAQTGGRRLIVAPGCVIPTNVPAANLLAARRAVEER